MLADLRATCHTDPSRNASECHWRSTATNSNSNPKPTRERHTTTADESNGVPLSEERERAFASDARPGPRATHTESRRNPHRSNRPRARPEPRCRFTRETTRSNTTAKGPSPATLPEYTAREVINSMRQAVPRIAIPRGDRRQNLRADPGPKGPRWISPSATRRQRGEGPGMGATT